MNSNSFFWTINVDISFQLCITIFEVLLQNRYTSVTSCLPYLSDTWIKTYLNVHIPASSFICMLWTINFTNTSYILHVNLPFFLQNVIKRIFLMNVCLLSTVDYPQNFTNSLKKVRCQWSLLTTCMATYLSCWKPFGNILNYLFIFIYYLFDTICILVMMFTYNALYILYVIILIV